MSQTGDDARPDDTPGADDAATQPLGMAFGDRCANCGAPLASDQRYCVNCGERRGKPRFTLATPADTVVQETVTSTRGGGPRRPRTSASFNLIAGIATLLLAMGIGVLIGHDSATGSTPSRVASTPAVQVVTVGGGAGNTTAGSTGTGGSGGSTSRTHAKGKSHGAGKAKSASAAAKPPAAVVQKAATAAGKVLGGATNTAPVTVTQGGSCSSGAAGCSGGHFSGTFFGGG